MQKLTNKYFWIPILFAILAFLLSNRLGIRGAQLLALLTGGFVIVHRLNPAINYYILLSSMLFTDSFSGTIWGQNFGYLATPDFFAAYAWVMGFITLFHFFILGRGVYFKFIEIDKYLFLFVSLIIISTILSIDVANSLKGLSRYPSFIILYFLTRLVFINKYEITNFINYSFGVLLVIFFIAIYKVITFQPYGTIGNFLFFLAPVGSVLYHRYLNNKQFASKLWLLIMVFGSFLLLVSESRRALLSILIAWLGILRINKINLTSLIVISLVALLGIQLIGDMTRYDKTWSQLGDVFRGDRSEQKLESISTGRYGLWEAGMKMIAEYPITGVGLRNHMSEILRFGTNRSQRIHNVFLDTAAQAGIPALLLLVAILINIWKRTTKAIKLLFGKNEAELVKIIWGLRISLIILIVISFFGGSMLLDKFGWFQFGFIIAITKYVYESRSLRVIAPGTYSK